MESFEELVVDGVTTTNLATPQYASIQAKNFARMLIYVKEDNTDAVSITLEARVANHSKAEWFEILAAQDIAKNGKLIIGSTTLTLTDYVECELLELPWHELRLKYYSTVDDDHGKVYAFANRRKR